MSIETGVVGLESQGMVFSVEVDNSCVWEYEEGGYGFFTTSCGNSFEFSEGDSGPDENDFKFCPFCGEDILTAYITHEKDEDVPVVAGEAYLDISGMKL